MVIPIRDPGGLPLMLSGMPDVDEVIVVTEGLLGDTVTAAQTARPDALVIRPARAGIGNALASGLAASNGDVVVTLNGDGSTDPRDIPRFVATLTGGADVAIGSRYCAGGRDLTGGRFRRWADMLLIWLVNALFGTERTDPGFGYVAFWRDAMDRLDLPDPSSRKPAAWGDGPEIAPLLSVRPEARGLRVIEIGTVAFPRVSRQDRAGAREWLRVLTREYRKQSGRHTAAAASSEAILAPLRARTDEIRAAAGLSGTPAAWAEANRRQGEPIWGPPRRRPAPSRDLWRDGENTLPHLSARSSDNSKPRAVRSGHEQRAAGTDVKSRSGGDHRPDPAAAQHAPVQQAKAKPSREIGTHRRHLEGFRQRPNLRLINGEGTGTHRSRNGRLRAVPGENPA